MTSLRTLVAAAALVLIAPVVAAAQQTTVILVRHAEKAAVGGNDPALSENGRARAQALARQIAADSVTTILVTPYIRTGETARFVADARHITPQAIPVQGELAAHAAAVVAAVRANPGKKVLVVGHSNTIPALIAALGGPTITIADAEYANIFRIVIDPSGAAVFSRACYGQPDESGSCVAR